MNLAARARGSARVIVDLLRSALPVSSVADFGGALGTWLSVWRDAGTEDVIGVDGSYVRIEDLQIPPQLFHTQDLAGFMDLGRRFDLIESMEGRGALTRSRGGRVCRLPRSSR